MADMAFFRSRQLALTIPLFQEVKANEHRISNTIMDLMEHYDLTASAISLGGEIWLIMQITDTTKDPDLASTSVYFNLGKLDVTLDT